MSILVTGAAGLVGANLVPELLDAGEQVVGMDNLCRGSVENLAAVIDHPGFSLQVLDLDDIDSYRQALTVANSQNPITEVWHLAANSDIPAGVDDPAVDLRDTFMTTYNTLLLMAELGIRSLAFASSSAVYGDLGEQVLEEDTGPLFPISNYGAMKLASEAAISAAAESHLDHTWIFRFPNVVGVPATHGVILDLVRKLKVTPAQLDVLGDGTQQKSYLHVEELVAAMLFARQHAAERRNYFNIGADDAGVSVRSIAEQVVAEVSPGAQLRFGTEGRGWVGDVPKFRYSTAKLEALGWHPKLDSTQAIRKAIQQIANQERFA